MARKFVTVQCKLCGKDTQKPPSLVKWRKNLFCSKLCDGKYHRIDPNRTHRVCSTCGINKPRSEYSFRQGSPDGLNHYCRSCHNKRSLDYRNKNTEVLKDRQRTLYGNNKHTFKAKRIKQRYGITMEQVENLRDQQGGLCAICKLEPASHIDHDHVTDRVRGLLCNNCNTGLGMFQDNASLMAAGIKYLEDNRD